MEPKQQGQLSNIEAKLAQIDSDLKSLAAGIDENEMDTDGLSSDLKTEAEQLVAEFDADLSVIE